MELIRNTTLGKVEGFFQNGICKWYGIPFAQPPVGELRFKRARAANAWEGIRPCKHMSASPYSYACGSMAKMMQNKVPASEDCLFLNVWAPRNAENLPVFVWIYGGANHTGEASDPMYSLESFARKGVIGVNFNYRVGPLGFYNFSKWDSSFESNCALSDMIAALHWVKDNIAQFGGNPDNVTICGESAGGTAVYSLLASPAAQGLFQKAIAMSGLAGNVDSQYTQELNNKLFLERLGVKNTELQKLRQMKPEELRIGAEAVFTDNDVYPGILVSGAAVGDDLLPYTPWEAMEKGICKDVVCMFGTCKDEGTLFYLSKMECMNWKQVRTMLENSGHPEKYDALYGVYGHYPEKKAMQELARDRMFWADSMRCRNAQSKYNTVYAYRYDFVSGMCRLMGLGATHGSDVGSGLDTWEGSLDMLTKLTPKKTKKKIHGYMHGSFVRFCKTGNPNGAIELEWKPYTEEEGATLLFDKKCEMAYKPNAENFEVWRDFYPYA